MISSCGEKATPSRSFEFIYDLSIPDIPETAVRLDIWIPFPQSDLYQKISDMKIESNHPHSINTETTFGNKMLYVKAEEALSAPIHVRLSFKATRQSRMDLKSDNKPSFLLNSGELQKYLEPDVLVPIDGIIAEEAAKTVTGDMNDLEKARAIYEHVTKTLAYDKSGEGWGRGDALYACNIRKGNCTDFHSLFIGMARAIGIPARFIIGFPLPDDSSQDIIKGYHCWSEFYIADKGWVSIDASEAYKHPEKHEFFFGNLDPNRLHFTIGRDIELKPQVTKERMNYFIYPYILLDGQPFSEFETQFSFKDIEDQG
jgi:transglutaminase-like putative cysteine protease